MPELLYCNRGGGGDRRVGRRRLLGGEGDLQGILAARDGVEYDPNSLAWRYLGLYVDCDGGGEDGNQGGEGGGGYCQRRLLWAAYINPRYKQYQGNSIEEYQPYDVASGGWDGTACSSLRCSCLTCHEAGTKFELLGVLKETGGIDMIHLSLLL